jgi:hypothetical protein
LKNGEEIIESIINAEKLKDDLIEYEQDMLQYERSGKIGKAPEPPSLRNLGNPKSLPE